MASIMAEKKYENIIKDIMRCIEEQVELEEYELRGNGEPQFQVTMINGEEVPEGYILLTNLKRTFSYMSSGKTYINIDESNYHGLLEIYYCKKKKGLFNKESLKTIHSIRKPFHKGALESGKEEMVSLKKLMGN